LSPEHPLQQLGPWGAAARWWHSNLMGIHIVEGRELLKQVP
jgi:hypothetical protein